MIKNLYIFGCSGIAKSIYDSILRSNQISFKNIYFVDADKKKTERVFYDGITPILLGDLNKKECYKQNVIFAFFKPENILNRKEIIDSYVKNFKFERITIVDSSAVISPSARIGKGTYVGPNVVIDSDAVVSNDNIILFNTVVSREVRIEENVFISANVVIKGSVKISESVFISASSIITNNIPSKVFINAGVMINSPLESNYIVGNKEIKNKVKIPIEYNKALRNLRFFHP